METRKHTNKLQKSSVLFLQLGLVLTLLTTYLTFELKTEQKLYDPPPLTDNEKPYEFKPYEVIEIERPIVKKSKLIAKKQFSPVFKIGKEDVKEEDTLPFEPINPDKENPVDRYYKYVEPVKEVFSEDVLPYTAIQEVPIFPGCEKVKKSKRRACFDKKMQSHIQRKFNSEAVNQLSLSSGVQKIYVKFLISKAGDIEVLEARAPHKKLMIEGKRVVKKLPKMIPGKQNGENVGVSYILPITFQVD